MTEKNDMPTETNGAGHALQVKVAMQGGEQTAQPIYSNLTSVQNAQGVVMVDFGFMDPQTMQLLNQKIASGEKISDTITAKMSCRMAVSVDAANQLSQQLNQLLGLNPNVHKQAVQQKRAEQSESMVTKLDTDAIPKEESDKQESGKGGFRFPWSKKTH
ncbi:hypothetical protein C8R26_101119 [Nitrosomonas oligotropha]|uniref:Uncharacterized protein n=1 Tax=Nitrosomonas oligotropha TaxID=42354 RepID=A0A2T5I4Q6_9PROT|nr:hypothetical protein [Nitrosomonas oligotropha]PTQ78803.1 hypothetical protein C8R26_101119 [Nitrosomonas oligotropha]